MKYPAVLVLLGALLAAAAPAWAQYGLYGSPEMLDLRPATSGAPQYAYPSTPTQPLYSPDAATFNTAAPDPYRVAQSIPPAPGQYAFGPSPGLQSPSPAGRTLRPTPVQPQAPSVVNQMLAESGGYPCTSGCGGGYSGGYVYGPGGCGMDAGCGPYAGTPLWYASASWLIMGRDQPNTLWTTYETNNNANQLPTEIGLKWGNGGQVSVGRRFCCGEWSLEGTYWGLGDMEGDVSVTHPNTVSTPLDFTDVVYANPAIIGLPVDLFDGAQEHRLWRRDEFHDIELNMVHDGDFGIARDPCRRSLDVDWLIGVRYFRFEEQWAFTSLRQFGSWANPSEVGHLEDRITNSLVGFQFGFNVDYQCHQNVSLFLRPRFGIYNNHINHTFLAYRGDGELFAPDPNSGVPGSYPVHSNVNGLSFLTEIDLGLDWQFACRWNAFVGYRVVAATGIGLADNQIPPYVVDIPEIAAIDRNGDLVLHGAFVGVSCNF